ncbi:MAG: cob(I)yrinic acid a,c-diamide adenosyltransferase [Victivallaceae bacterium]
MIKQEERNKRRGLLINITGHGKGKTTSALGTCLRALGWGWKAAVVQFIKNDCETGEKHFAGKAGMPFEICSIGAGFTWRKNGSKDQDIQCAENAWQQVEKYIAEANVDLLVLDELNIALDKKFLSMDKVIAALCGRPSWLHIIITGRNAPAELIEVCDLVSEIQEIKHPFNAGIPAQKGIEF